MSKTGWTPHIPHVSPTGRYTTCRNSKYLVLAELEWVEFETFETIFLIAFSVLWVWALQLFSHSIWEALLLFRTELLLSISVSNGPTHAIVLQSCSRRSLLVSMPQELAQNSTFAKSNQNMLHHCCPVSGNSAFSKSLLKGSEIEG